MSKFYGIVFGHCNSSVQSMMKVVPYYKNTSKDFICLWIREELKKITAVVDIKANPRLSLTEHLISFVTMR